MFLLLSQTGLLTEQIFYTPTFCDINDKGEIAIHTLDNDIQAKTVRVVGVEGYDIMSIEDALDLADEMGMNLVAMNDQEVPVCKFMNYQKFLYEQKKRAKENKGNKVETKEVRFDPTIADRDLAIKAKTATRLLNEGDKVRVSVMYRGRMISFIKNGIGLIEKFNSMIGCEYSIDSPPKIEGNRVIELISFKR